jgi:hypothetical protein
VGLGAGTKAGRQVRSVTVRVNVKKTPHDARFALSVLYGSQNRQRPLLYTSFLVGFYNRGGKFLKRGTDSFGVDSRIGPTILLNQMWR